MRSVFQKNLTVALNALLLVFPMYGAAHAKTANGILVIAHGTSLHDGGGHGGGHPHLSAPNCTPLKPSKWEQAVLDAATRAQSGIETPVEVAFGMWESYCYDQAIERLKIRLARRSDTLGHLTIVPLFISDYSSIIEAQKYIFHLRPNSPLPELGIQPSNYRGPLTYGHAIGYNPLISKVLVDRAKSLLKLASARGFAPQKTELVLAMHGPIEDDANAKWLEMGRAYGKDLKKTLRLTSVRIVSLRDDAEPEVRNRATAELLSYVDGARARGGIALVVPLLLSRGGIEAGIAFRMKGHDVIWTGETLFPDVRMESWLRQQFDTYPGLEESVTGCAQVPVIGRLTGNH
jgi:hypothetical protein